MEAHEHLNLIATERVEVMEMLRIRKRAMVPGILVMVKQVLAVELAEIDAVECLLAHGVPTFRTMPLVASSSIRSSSFRTCVAILHPTKQGTPNSRETMAA